jgi:glucose/arabinose dehydrogenase
MRRLPATALLAVAVTLAAACGGGDDETASPTTATPSTNPAGGGDGPTTTAGGDRPGIAPDVPDLEGVRLSVTRVARLAQPLALAVRPGDPALYVAEKGGRVRRIANGQAGGEPSVEDGALLDLSGEVSRAYEQGLLGLTFSPDGGRMYVSYTDRSGDSQIVEYGFRDGRVDTGSRRRVLSVDQPFANHNGGQVTFGPDGMLYVGFGDGGSQYDPNGNGQDLGILLAKILRIDPRPSGDRGYTVPADNPFVGRSGARPETWVWGLRNPWRFSFDRQGGDLWIGDAGQDEWEEVDFLPREATAGANLGWSLMDSRHPFRGQNPPGGVLPIVEYSHEGSHCAVTGGYVYRGTAIPALRGAYLYADACSGAMWGLSRLGEGAGTPRRLDPGTRLGGVWSFGEDAAGQLYVLTSDSVYRLVAG